MEGVLDSDPRTNPNAKLIKHLTFQKVVEQKLGVMDLTAVAMLEDTDIQIRVFNMAEPNDVVRVVQGDDLGTTISKE